MNMLISNLNNNFMGATRFGYDDDISTKRRDYIRHHLTDDIFQSSDVFKDNPRLEEYRLSMLIKGLTKKGFVKDNKKSQINPKIMEKLPLFNVEPIYGTSSYRGSTSNINENTAIQLKKAGVEGVISFNQRAKFSMRAIMDAGLELYSFPVGIGFWNNDAFRLKSDVINTIKSYQAIYQKRGLEIDINKDMEEELNEWENEKREFIDKFTGYILEMQKPNRYVGCTWGVDRTDEMLMLNYFFNPKTKGEFVYFFEDMDFYAQKIRKLYGNLTPKDKQKMGWDDEFDKDFIPRLKKWAPNINI